MFSVNNISRTVKPNSVDSFVYSPTYRSIWSIEIHIDGKIEKEEQPSNIVDDDNLKNIVNNYISSDLCQHFIGKYKRYVSSRCDHIVVEDRQGNKIANFAITNNNININSCKNKQFIYPLKITYHNFSYDNEKKVKYIIENFNYL